MSEITTLQDLQHGRYWVITSSGTRHLVDLDKQTVTRYGAPGHEWGEDNPNSVAGVDGEPFFFTRLTGAAVGEQMFMSYKGSYLESDYWRRTSTVRSIEVAE